MSKLLVSAAVLISLLLAGTVPGLAQDSPLAEEQIALVNRAVAARNSLDARASYVETAQGQSRYEIAAQGTDGPPLFSSVQVWSRETSVVRDADALTIQALISLAVKHQASNENETNYSVEAEARVVDDVLYVTAAYVGPDSDAVPESLPAGWQQVDDLASHPVYDDLQLDDLIETPELFDAPEVIMASASDVTLVTETLDDDTVADVITITIDAEGMAIVLREYQAVNVIDNTALFLALADAVSENSAWEIVVVLDDADTPLAFRTTSLIQALDVPASVLGLADDAARFTIVIDNAREHTYTRLDDDGLAPVPQPSLNQ